MEAREAVVSNVRQAVPFFGVTDIEASLHFYVSGLSFKMKHHWAPEGCIRWCWLELGDAALMLQEYWKDGRRGGRQLGRLDREYRSASCARTPSRSITMRLGVGFRIASVVDG